VAATEVLKDLDLCRRAQAGDVDAMEEVLQGSTAFINWTMRRVIGNRRLPPNVSWEDGMQEGMVALLRILQPKAELSSAWDGHRPLTTFAARCVENQIRRWVSHAFPCVHVPEQQYEIALNANSLSLDAPIDADDTGRVLGDCIADLSSDPLAVLEARDERQEQAARLEEAMKAKRTSAVRVMRTGCRRSKRRYSTIPVQLIISDRDRVLDSIRKSARAAGGEVVLSSEEIAHRSGLSAKAVSAHIRWLCASHKVERRLVDRQWLFRIPAGAIPKGIAQKIDFDALAQAN